MPLILEAGARGGGVVAPNQKVLVVDDDSDVLSLLAEAISRLDCQVLVAGSGEEALQLFLRERPPVVLTDLRMPGLDGLALMQSIRNAEPLTHVLIITAHADFQSAIEAVRQGAFDYLPKPPDLPIVLQRVCHALNHHRLISEREGLLEELQRANQALRAAQAEMVEKERLAAIAQIVVGLHHSILNPLSGILGVLQLLKGDRLESDAKIEALALAELEIHKIEDVVKRLRLLERTAAAPYVGDTTMLDLERRPAGQETP